MNKQEQYKNLLKFVSILLIWSIQVGIWAYFWMGEYAEEIMRPFGYKGNWLVLAVYGIISFFFTSIYGGYRVGYYRREDVILSGFISIVFTNVITYLQTCLVGRAIMEVSPFIWMTAADTIALLIWAVAACGVYGRVFPPHKMLLVYGGNTLATNLVQKMSGRTEKFHIQESVSIDSGQDTVKERIVNYPSVILCDVPAGSRNSLIKFCFEKDIRVYTTPKISDILIRSAENITLFDTPLLLNRNRGLSLEQRFFKRLVDIVFAVVMLVVTSPFMLVAAAAVKLEDGGPIIYRQTRLTQHGRVFSVYKFRSMIVDAEGKTGAQLSPEDDERITRVGGIMRKFRIDELPQLWNILTGAMSVVGPRPERPELVAEYTKDMPEFGYRLKVRAGLTGYAQVIGKYNTTAYDKLKMDLMYIAGYSLILDFKIMFMTFKILFLN